MSEWDQREMCPDGACTGVIGDDGTCKVCGKQGVAPLTASRADADDHEDADEDAYEDDGEDEDEDDEQDEASGSGSSGQGQWEERELCSDGACVGVLDDTGACKVCGKKSPTWKPRTVRAPAPVVDAELRAAAADLAASVPAADVAAIAPAPSASSDDEEQRALCPDGACVGVIGKDGKCKLCGTEAA